MKVTNKYNLPKSFVISADSGHERGDNLFSVTQLQKGTCEIVLDRQHYDEAEDDVSNRVWAIFGTAVHSIFEKEETDETIVEMQMKYEILHGIYWTGRCDLYDIRENVIKDFKTASVWKFKMNDFEDWRKQLADYCCLLELCEGQRCRKGQIIALLKDHSKTDASRDQSYPQLPCVTVEFNFTDEEIAKRVEIARAKISDVLKAEEAYKELGYIFPCSEEERWASPRKFAVKKPNVQKAVKLFDSKEEAEAFIADKPTFSIEERAGVNRKCEGYCLYKKWCPLYRE